MLRTAHQWLVECLVHTASADDVWRRHALREIPIARYGLGAKQAFSWYLERESTVSIDSLEALRTWLRGCAYRCDPDQFDDADYWQHPVDFEARRAGDCEDFALWAWRKLTKELRLDAEFVVGRFAEGHGAAHHAAHDGHAWVQFVREDRTFLLDPVCEGPMFWPLDAVRHRYIPEVSIDGALQPYAYAGYLLLRRTGEAPGEAPPTRPSPPLRTFFEALRARIIRPAALR